MLTPAGKECSFFYGDYHRGRSKEECRLLDSNGLSWKPVLCHNCPIPNIQIANACEHMRFYPKIAKGFLIRKPHVSVDIYCTKCECSVTEPRVGCGQCHPLPSVFVVAPEDPKLSEE